MKKSIILCIYVVCYSTISFAQTAHDHMDNSRYRAARDAIIAEERRVQAIEDEKVLAVYNNPEKRCEVYKQFFKGGAEGVSLNQRQARFTAYNSIALMAGTGAVSTGVITSIIRSKNDELLRAAQSAITVTNTLETSFSKIFRDVALEAIDEANIGWNDLDDVSKLRSSATSASSLDELVTSFRSRLQALTRPNSPLVQSLKSSFAKMGIPEDDMARSMILQVRAEVDKLVLRGNSDNVADFLMDMMMKGYQTEAQLADNISAGFVQRTIGRSPILSKIITTHWNRVPAHLLPRIAAHCTSSTVRSAIAKGGKPIITAGATGLTSGLKFLTGPVGTAIMMSLTSTDLGDGTLTASIGRNPSSLVEFLEDPENELGYDYVCDSGVQSMYFPKEFFDKVYYANQVVNEVTSQFDDPLAASLELEAQECFDSEEPREYGQSPFTYDEIYNESEVETAK